MTIRRTIINGEAIEHTDGAIMGFEMIVHKPDPVVPNPGSEAAVKLGCACPVYDNGHGYGYNGVATVFVFHLKCPLHKVVRR